MITKPRVFLLSQAPGVGGGERVVLNALAIAQEVEVVVAGHLEVCKFARNLDIQAELLELPWISSFRNLRHLIPGALRVARRCKTLNVDVVYANGTRAFPYAIGEKLLGGPNVIAHHHGFFSGGPSWLLTAGVDAFAEAIVVPTVEVAGPFRAQGKVKVIPNGIDLSRFAPPKDRAAIRRRLGLSPEVSVVGTVSRAAKGKGMDTFLDFAEKLSKSRNDVKFIMAGGATFPHEKERYESLVKRAQSSLGDRILVTGPVRDPEDIYGALDVFAHLNGPEAFPTTALEAMACGVPVVGLGWGGIREIVQDGRTGKLLDPNATDAIAEAVTDLLDHPDRAKALGIAGRALCEERFSIERFSSELESLIQASI